MLNVLTLPILTILLISGCSTTKSLQVFTKEVERMPLNLELPPVETLEQVNVMIVTSKNQEEVFAKMKEANIDPVVFGIFTVLTCEIGFLTPPIGINLFVAARITGDSIEKISIGVLPLLIPYILMVLILVYFSDWVTYLPDLVYGVSK